MTQTTEIKVPDIGDFTDVPIIEIHVSPGTSVEKEDPLITLESDKATMDVPAPQAGIVKELKVAVGDTVSQDSLIATMEPSVTPESAVTEPKSETSAPIPETATYETAASGVSQDADIQADIVVLGSGPGGYSAAFRAADLGLNTVLVERYPNLGGVCLNVGCIPSKALLHAAKVIADTKEMNEYGIRFGEPEIEIDKLRGWKNKVVKQLTGGLAGLAKQRKVKVVQGVGRFTSPHQISINNNGAKTSIGFSQAIIAAGSQATHIPAFPHDDPRIIDSTGALELTDIPHRLLVVGGGIIGLEMATVYYELGSKVTVVELLDSLMTGADPDIIRPFHNRIKKQYENIFLGTRVTAMHARDEGIVVEFDGKGAPQSDTFDRVLVAVGRQANGHNIGADKAGVQVDQQGLIAADTQQRTNVAHVFAIGDITGQPMLAHKATHQGKVAAEVAAGLKSGFDAKVIPSVAYTDPEVAWVGVTELEANAQGLNYGKGVFPWAASGRSLSIGRNEGMTKLLFDKDNDRVIGAGIVGTNAGDLIAEVALAIEMGCDAQDIGLTIHPHPTLSETVGFAAEAFEGSITDLYIPKKK